MVRYASEHRQGTHEAILAAASELVRLHGFDGASVATVMKAVGLTHGGFYAHFADKTAMLAAATERALQPTVERFEAFVATAEQTGDPADVAGKYLSDTHLADVAGGCAAAALVSEVARQPDPVRQVFRDGAVASSEILARVFPGEPGARAWGVFAMMSGALALMRAIPDDTLRTEIRAVVTADLRRLADGRRN